MCSNLQYILDGLPGKPVNLYRMFASKSAKYFDLSINIFCKQKNNSKYCSKRGQNKIKAMYCKLNINCSFPCLNIFSKMANKITNKVNY